MSTREIFIIRNRVSLTVLVTLAWLVVLPCWVVLAWGRFSFFQALVGLGIITLLYAAISGVLWVVDQGFVMTATVIVTMGWLSFALYWIGFAWSGFTLLQNGAVLTGSFLTCWAFIIWSWRAILPDRVC